MSKGSTAPSSKAGAQNTSRAQHTNGSGGSLSSERWQQASRHYVAEPAKDMFAALQSYAKQNPDVAAVWCFGLGVIVGWKLRG